MGDVQQMGIQPVGIEALQGLDDLQVNPLASGGTWIGVKHVPDQWVSELKERSIALKYVLAHPFLQEVEHVLCTLAAQRTEDLQGEALAQE
jgi:hypothetical protein